ncbi:hypothetical protein L1987_42903 [Smallanthus sonchifolius]|uniref:Uncharacterized protein n=1 Tax=Smallanthus sonchifolius TaxID=185202 RepID=A0ACB9GLB2_9ASTR|nr:hypothetical protein L1987_42903 [Smallanthus sonchifolius]
MEPPKLMRLAQVAEEEHIRIHHAIRQSKLIFSLLFFITSVEFEDKFIHGFDLRPGKHTKQNQHQTSRNPILRIYQEIKPLIQNTPSYSPDHHILSIRELPRDSKNHQHHKKLT